MGTTYFHGGNGQGDCDVGLEEDRGERKETDTDEVYVSFSKEKKTELLL